MTTQTMHKIGTREEWLAARLELLKAEKELTHRSDELARQRQELPWIQVNKGYRFETEAGGTSLPAAHPARPSRMASTESQYTWQIMT